MDFSNEGKMNKPEQGPKVIDNDKDFRYSYADAKNQFFGMIFDSTHKKLSLEELQQRNKEISYLSFLEYIKKEKNLVLSPKIADEEKYKQAILIHDDLIERIKKFKSIPELKQILEEVNEFIIEDF